VLSRRAAHRRHLISLVSLTVWFEAVTIAGGLAASSLIAAPFLTQQQSVVAALSLPTSACRCSKPASAVVAATACYHGLRVGLDHEILVATRGHAEPLLVVIVNVLLTVVFS
jgi:hypothetical protein